MKCPGCSSDVPEDSKFCPSCGRPMKAEDIDMILPPDGSRTEERATLYLVFAIACLFFGIFLIIPGVFVGWGLILPALGLAVLGIILLIARYAVLRRYAAKVEALRKESLIRVRCQYCGALNPQDALKCSRCSAPMV